METVAALRTLLPNVDPADLTYADRAMLIDFVAAALHAANTGVARSA